MTINLPHHGAYKRVYQNYAGNRHIYIHLSCLGVLASASFASNPSLDSILAQVIS
jgi:hypothetical protein